jgi:nicotinate-nucleotide adenylyltransferase
VRLAVDGNPRFEVDPLECERRGRSYSIDTLREFAGRLAPERPVFLIGSDAFRLIDTWREPEAIFALVHLAVIVRPPAAGGSLAAWLPAKLRGEFELAADGRSGRHPGGSWLRLLEIAGLDVSASDLRARLRQGRSVRYLLPEAVRRAVKESGVYAGR